MLLRSAFTPPFTAANPPNLVFSSNKYLTRQCPQTVRRNASQTTASLLDLHKSPPLSAYVHLPFCRKRCHYCYIPIIPLGYSSSNPDKYYHDPNISNYVETLRREIMATKIKSTNRPPLETVYLGGGTPSLVPPPLVSFILDTLSLKFGVSGNAEISMEMDPGTFDAALMEEMMNLGVNRVSMGVQAFQEELLKSCGRTHTVDDIFEAVETVKSCGLENWSMDLIFSLPYQTLSMWEETLKLAVEAGPTHISVFQVSVEPNTKFAALYTPREFPLLSENEAVEFYKTASRMLRNAGYDHYDDFSYCKTGYRSKHTSAYWNFKPYYGFGLGSRSYTNGMTFWRPKKLKEYTKYVLYLEDGLFDRIPDKIVDAEELAMEVILDCMRTADGLDLKSFRETFGDSIMVSALEDFRPVFESGYVICRDEQGRNVTVDEIISSLSNELKVGFLRFTDPDGFILSSDLLSPALDCWDDDFDSS